MPELFEPSSFEARHDASAEMAAGARNNLHAVRVMLRLTARARRRLLAAIEGGASDFIIASVDGSATVRAGLVIYSGDVLGERIAERVTVDWVGGFVRHRGQQTSVSRTELRILAMLLDRRGRTISRQELARAVFAEGTACTANASRAISVYVCSLRKRLRSIGLGDVVETRRGSGYRVVLGPGRH